VGRLLERVSAVRTALWSPQDLVGRAVLRWQTLVAKILHDEFSVACDAAGMVSKATLRLKHIKGSYVIGSVVDPEATFRYHGDRCELGYNISVAATPNFIREIAAATGAVPDSQGVAPLVAAQQAALGCVPPKLIYDQAAGMPKIFADVSRVTGGATQLVARLIQHGQADGRFHPLDFALGEDGGLTCPQQQTTYGRCRSQTADGWVYRFPVDLCQACPLTAPCRGNKLATHKPRTVFVTDYVFHQRRALAYLATPAAQVDLRRRAYIERIIAGLVRYQGARRAVACGGGCLQSQRLGPTNQRKALSKTHAPPPRHRISQRRAAAACAKVAAGLGAARTLGAHGIPHTRTWSPRCTT